MFTQQIERLQELRGLPPNEAINRLTDILGSVLGTCAQALEHRGPLTINAGTGNAPTGPAGHGGPGVQPPLSNNPPTVTINDNTALNEDGEEPDDPAGPFNEGGPASETFKPSNNTSTVKIINHNSRPDESVPNSVKINGGFGLMVYGVSYLQHAVIGNVYNKRGRKYIFGKVKVDEDDDLDYLEDQFEDLTGDAPAAEDWIVKVRNNNGALQLYVEPDIPGPCIDIAFQSTLFGGPVSLSESGILTQSTYSIGYDVDGCLTLTEGTPVEIDVCVCESPVVESECCEEGLPATLYVSWDNGEAVLTYDGTTIPPTWNSTYPGGSHSGTYLGTTVDSVNAYCEYNEGTNLASMSVDFEVDGGIQGHRKDESDEFCSIDLPVTVWTAPVTDLENVVLDGEAP